MPIFRYYFQKYGTIFLMSIVFWSMFFGNLIQGWNSLLLLIIPLFQYLLFIWFQIENILKTPLVIGNIRLYFYNLGNTKQISIKFGAFALSESLIILIMGIDANYHPQLIENYFILYIGLIGLLSIFSVYFSMHSILEKSHIEIQDQNRTTRVELKKEVQKLIHKINIILVISEVILWIGFSILAYFNIFSFSVSIPGSSELLTVTYLLFFIVFSIIVTPVALSMYIHYSILNEFSHSIKNLSQSTQNLLRTTLRNYLLFPRFLKA